MPHAVVVIFTMFRFTRESCCTEI